MRPSRQFIVMGVGVLLAFSSMPSGAAESAPSQAQATADEPQPASPTASTATIAPNTVLPIAKPESMTAANTYVQTGEPNKSGSPQQFSPKRVTIPAIAPNLSGVAQATPSTTPNLAPPLQSQPSGAQPSGAQTQTQIPPLTTPDPGPSRPLGPAKPGAAPEYLNPDPNPLSFPTKPSEVQLRGIQPISLDQAIELALRNNRQYQVSKLQLQRDEAALRQAQAASYPTLSLSSSVARSESASGKLSNARQGNNSLSSLFGINNTGDTISNVFNGSLSLSYDLFTSGLRPANIRAAERQVRADQLQVEINREQLALDVAGNYYNLQQADEAVRIQQASVRNNEASLRDTQALERAGLGTRFDVLQSEVQLANSRQNLTNAIAQQEISRRQLAQQLSLSPAIDLAAADPVAVAGEWNLSLEQSIVLAFKNRAELEQQLVLRELYQQQRRAALAGLGPTVALSAQYSLYDVLDDNFAVQDGYQFAASVNWNIFDGGASVARARQAEANIAIAEQNFADQRDQIRFTVEQGYANLLSNFENIGTTTLAVTQAQEALRLARLRFQAGVGTSTDVINAENALTTAEGNRVNAILGYNRALATLKRAVSNLPVATALTPPTAPQQSSPGNPIAPSTPNPAPPGTVQPGTTAPGTTPPRTPAPSTTTP